MRYLFDIAHPAHVHFYRHMIRELEDGGHTTLVVAREKDVTLALLDLFGIPHVPVGSAQGAGLVARGRELVGRDVALWRLARRFRPDVILTRNPAGVQVARALRRTVGVFDTDDGRAAGIHFKAAAPFAHHITTPDCFGEDYGRKHVKYPSYKALAYLHPDRFTPDPSVLAELGVEEGEPYFLVRFVAMAASHDSHEAGLPAAAKAELVARLQREGRVFVSSERELPDQFAPLALPTPPHRLHDVLAFSRMLVGDSQTMAAEAALLGVPSLRCSSFAGRLVYLEELEHRYGLTFGFRPEQFAEMQRRLDELLTDGAGDDFADRHAAMLDDKCDLTRWYLDFVDRL